MPYKLRQIVLKVQYDGSGFHGFQKQPSVRTVQNEIEEAVSAVVKEKIITKSTSRTDAGVHAFNQLVSFTTTNTTIPADKFSFVLNSVLPPDIVIRDSFLASSNFDVRRMKSKEYHYLCYLSSYRIPFLDKNFYHIKQKLNFKEMQKACALFIGEKDFSAFQNKGSTPDNPVKTVYEFDFYWKDIFLNSETEKCSYQSPNYQIIKLPNYHQPSAISHQPSVPYHFPILVFFRIKASGFLYKMARNMVGLVLKVGMGKIPSEEVINIILSKNRTKAGATLPPQALYLVNIEI